MKRYSALPPNLSPRLIDRAAAAAYCGIGTTKFDEMVNARTLPQPQKGFGSRKLWDVQKLDRAIDRLSDDGEADRETDDVWSRVAV